MGLYHVETSGSDTTGDGSAASPWRSVAHTLATAEPGSTLLVGPGEFVEAFQIAKDVTIIGRGRTATTLRFSQPADPHQPVVRVVGAARVRLEGLRIDGAHAPFDFNRNGIFAEDGGAIVEVERCAIEGFLNFYIKVAQARLVVSNTLISVEPAYMNDVGIQTWDSTATITNVTIGNQVDHCIDMRGTSHADIVHCTLNGSSGGNNHGIRMLDSSTAWIGYNTIVGAGLNLAGFDQGIQAGIFLNDTALAGIYHNEISGFAVGLRLWTAASCRVWSNRITNNVDWGIEGWRFAEATAFQPDLGGGRHGSPGGNVIRDNGAAGGNDVKLQGTGVLYARFNDWGTSDPAEIQSRVTVGVAGPFGPPTIDFLPVQQVPPPTPLDSVVLVDRSGSMLAQGKWTSALDGVERLTAVMSDIACNAPSLRIAAVTFALTGSGMTQTPRPLAALPTDPAEMTAALTPPQPWWMTPLGEGLDTARNVLGLLDNGRRKAVFLLSDGKNNSGRDPATIYPGFQGRINVYSIGYGDDAIDPEMLSDVSSGTYGDYTLTGSTDRLTLHAFLLNSLAGPLNVELVLNTTDSAVMSFPVNDGESRMVVHLGWADRGTRLDFDLEDPGGAVHTPAALPTSITYRPANGTASASYVVQNPQPGDWKITNIRQTGGGPIPPTVRFVALDPRVVAQFWIDRGAKRVGEPFRLSARVLEDNVTLETVDVGVEVVAPRLGVGEVASAHAPAFRERLGSLRSTKDFGPEDFFSALLRDAMAREGWKQLPEVRDRLALRAPAPRGLPGLQPPLQPPRDPMPAGLRETEYTPTVEGTHSFRFTATGRTASGAPILRSYRMSTFVRFRADPRNTPVQVQSLGQWQKGLHRFRVIVTPRGAARDRMGPFRSDRLAFQVDGGRFIGEIGDDHTGSYFRDLVASASEPPRALTVFVDDVRIPVPDDAFAVTGSSTPSKRAPRRKRRA